MGSGLQAEKGMGRFAFEARYPDTLSTVGTLSSCIVAIGMALHNVCNPDRNTQQSTTIQTVRFQAAIGMRMHRSLPRTLLGTCVAMVQNT